MKKARVVNSPIVSEMCKDASLKTRLYVLNEMMIQAHLIEIGVIPDGFWSDEKEEKFGDLFRPFAKMLTKNQMTEIKQWEQDGRPK